VATVLQRYTDSDWPSSKPFSRCIVIEYEQEKAKALLKLATHHWPQALFIPELPWSVQLSVPFQKDLTHSFDFSESENLSLTFLFKY
jgi:hypothetical protein